MNSQTRIWSRSRYTAAKQWLKLSEQERDSSALKEGFTSIDAIARTTGALRIVKEYEAAQRDNYATFGDLL